MHSCLNPFSFLVVSVAGWMSQHQQHVVEYLTEENRVLREQIGNRRMRFTDNQRCRLAARAKKLSRKILEQVATIVTPATLLALASEVDCQKVRRQRVPCTGPPTDGDGDYCACSSFRQRKPKLGISADPRRRRSGARTRRSMRTPFFLRSR